ncbi:hypothetical protein B566_EDAN003590 [Ephemera danica]|nr:hypothetical protein B566_EDAN003590 [Ephemera danica]
MVLLAQACYTKFRSKILIIFIIIPLLSASEIKSDELRLQNPETFLPTVVIAMMVRNKALALPYFLSSLEQLDYPKDRISLWIRSDHNEDQSLSILRHWLPTVENKYHAVDAELLTSPPTLFSDESGPTNWSSFRFLHMIRLREEALTHARNTWADYIWMLDSDAFFVNNQTLLDLVKQDLTISAPMLRSDGLYSNFWCGMSEDFYYIRTEDYKPILYRERTGCFPVPMVHSAVLINLRHKASGLLTYMDEQIPDYNGPEDDIITLALGAKHFGVPMHICNLENYGYLTAPLEEDQSLDVDETHLVNIKLEAIVDHDGFPLSSDLSRFVTFPEKDSAGLDEVFMINLERRPDRRHRMRGCFRELGLLATEVNAVDGR